ncbi:MAG: 16S rRNA (adenine(1518)-N(6)/adenine(1519)-N(6))-dimethyltransferase RsmA [Defluviitaleaceae bacterium]|nr:16S rRNA (adenine(1518)-N(6)/adenine(1519)-N(6))-dimethyltransferase RsmA [Defluviitaleaceae bacterium]
MIDLSTRAGVRHVIEQYGLQTKKKLGQHFLVDGHVLGKIIAAANVGEGDTVLEIGPGIGSMTQALAAHAGHVIAVELDKMLVPVLNTLFADAPVTIVQGDILRMDLKALLATHTETPVKVVANLPYYITTPVIFYLLESGLPFESITVMIQKEVAQRMAAKPSSKDYGALTLAVQYYADVEVAANVPVNCFMPRPAVDSAVAHLKILDKPRVDGDKDMIFKVIHAAFGKRRKTLLNAISSAGGVFDPFDKGEIAQMIESAGFNPQVRGETLDIFQFAKLAEVFAQGRVGLSK